MKRLFVPFLAICLMFLSCEHEEPEDPYFEYAVDLGLPSGLKWSDRNLGATDPISEGYYFSWGEVAPKQDYNDDKYKWLSADKTSIFPVLLRINKYQIADEEFNGIWYDGSSGKFIGDGNNQLDLEDDAAHVMWGGHWRMPTAKEAQELINNCRFRYESKNGKRYVVATGPNGNELSFPADTPPIPWNGGPYFGSFFWASELMTKTTSAYCFVASGDPPMGIPRNRGVNIRPVYSSK